MARYPASSNGLANLALSRGWCGEINRDWARHTDLLT
jgi:hypothetical protein